MHRCRHGLKNAFICLVALSCVQCGQPGDLGDHHSSTLVIHIPNQDESVLGPNGANPWFLVFLGLTADPEYTEVQQPRLLERWEHTADYTEWTAHLRDDVIWDDGVPVTAEDVKFSLELWTNPEIGYEYRYYEKITILDSHTLEITFKKPVAVTLFRYSWLAMVPKHSLDTLGVEQGQIFSWPFWVQPIGDGPYRYVRHVPKTMVELRANPDYFGEQPSIPRVVLQFGGKPLIELLSGNVDLATDITPLEAVQLAADPRFRVYHRVRSAQAVAIAWNHRNPLFQDAAVRKALTLAINRRELHRVLNYPDDLPIFDVPALTRHFVEGVVPEPLPFDPERAARLLTRSGWVDSDNNGIREKDGQEFRFALSVSPETSASAIYIQEQFKQVGVDMEISAQDQFALRHYIRDQVFEATIFRYNYTEQFNDFWLTGYVNPEASRLRDAAWFSIDKDEVDRNLEQLWKIFAEDVPVTYLHPSLSYSAAHRRIRGLNNGQDIFSTVEYLWIEDEE